MHIIVYKNYGQEVINNQWRQNELEVGEPVRRESGGGTDMAQRARKKLGRAPPLFGSKSTIYRFDERLRGGQYSLVSFLFAFLLLTVPPCPAICKSGGHVPPVPHGVPLSTTDELQTRLATICNDLPQNPLAIAVSQLKQQKITMTSNQVRIFNMAKIANVITKSTELLSICKYLQQNARK